MGPTAVSKVGQCALLAASYFLSKKWVRWRQHLEPALSRLDVGGTSSTGTHRELGYVGLGELQVLLPFEIRLLPSQNFIPQ